MYGHRSYMDVRVHARTSIVQRRTCRTPQVGFKLREHSLLDPSLLRGVARKIEVSGMFPAK